MNICVNCTADGVISYPPHKHINWEVMTYLSGEGYLFTLKKNYNFKKGTIILVPPGITHGSVSKTGFKNISISGDFDSILLGNKVVSVEDNFEQDGLNIAKVIFNNRSKGKEFISSMCTSYIYFLAQYLQYDSQIYATVDKIIVQITQNAFDASINLNKILSDSGYHNDYIRAKFKEFTGKTPTKFLNDMRIDRARFLINVFRDTLPLTHISEKCGFEDYIYFSKLFKKSVGISPQKYIQSIF